MVKIYIGKLQKLSMKTSECPQKNRIVVPCIKIDCSFKFNIFLPYLLGLFILGCSKEEAVVYTVSVDIQPSTAGQVNPANVTSIDEKKKMMDISWCTINLPFDD